MNDDAMNLCNRLDGDLLGEEREAFVAHAVHCAACREALNQQQWIDALLQSDEAAAIESAPPIALRLRSRRRALLLAAAALAALTAWPLFSLPRRDGSNRARSPVATERRAVAEAEFAPELIATVANPSPLPSLPGRGIPDTPVATFASNSRTIAVPIPASSPEVTIVKLYPVLKPNGATSAHGG